jgi:hypothetical protein
MISYNDLDPNHDIVEVLLTVGVAFSISLTEVESILKIISFAAAGAFTMWKFYVAVQDRKNKRK